jgi:hypothetical protein
MRSTIFLALGVAVLSACGSADEPATPSTADAAPDTSLPEVSPPDAVVDTTAPDTTAPETNDSGADATSDAADTDPADTNLADTNLADTNLADTNLADTNLADTNLADTLADTNLADTNLADTNLADTNAGETAGDTGGDAASEFRPWSGGTANLRLIDLRTEGRVRGTKLCVFGADADSRPYAVFHARSNDARFVGEVAAVYGKVPAGIPLKFSTIAQTSYDPRADAFGCRAALAVDPRGPSTLTQDRFYSVLNHRFDAAGLGRCSSRADVPQCAFYAASDASQPTASCARPGVYVVTDGERAPDGKYLGGYRVLDVTENAAQIMSSDGTGTSLHGHLDPHADFGTGYLLQTVAPGPGGDPVLRICASPICDPTVTSTQYAEALSSCRTNDASPFRLATVAKRRLAEKDRATTIYVFGNVGPVSASGLGLRSKEVTVLVANDVSDGALP